MFLTLAIQKDFFTRFRVVGLSNLRAHKFKHSFLVTLILFVFVGLILKHRITSFSTAQDLLTKDKTFCLRLKGSFPIFIEKATQLLHQYVFLAIRVFHLNLTATYSIHLSTTFYSYKSLNLLYLQRPSSSSFLFSS